MISPSDNKIVILHIMPELFPKGGTPRKLLSLVDNSAEDRFLHVFLLFNNCSDSLADDVKCTGGIVKEVSRLRNYDIRLLFDIIGIVRKYEVNIINTHFARADIYGVIAGLLCRIPVIKSVHGILWNKSRLMIYLDRLAAPFRYLTICNSRASLEAERKRSHAKKLKVIHNGVVPRDTKRSVEGSSAYREKLGFPPDCFLVGHVGGLIRLRHQDLIIEAVSILYEKGVDVYCAIVGKGPEEIRLKEHAKSLNVADRVRFLGYIDGIGEFLTSIDVFVNMAHSEGFGIAVVEAMFAGAPVVLANAGALPEIIIDNKSGILVQEGSSLDLADALLRLEADLSLRQSLGESAQKRAKEEFSITRFVSDLENVFVRCNEENR